MANVRRCVTLSVCAIIFIHVGYAAGQDEATIGLESPTTFSLCDFCMCTKTISDKEEQSNTQDIMCNGLKIKMDMEAIIWPVDNKTNINAYFEHLSMKSIQKLSKNNRIISLSFNNNEIRTIWPQAFASVINLKYLSLSNNMLNEIKADMFDKLDYLEELDLTNNKLMKFNEEGFQELKSLSVLRLDENNLEQIPGHFLAKLTKLEYLHISKNKISYLDYKDLNNRIEILSNIKVIDFSGNNLYLITKEHFEKTTSLKHLNLSHNVIETVESKAFINCVNLITLDLSYNKIAILTGIPLSVSVLHLEMNRFSNIPSLPNNLIYFDVNNNEITEINDETYESFGKLRFLNISKNYLNNDFNVKPIAALLILDISYNMITEIPEFLSESTFPELRELYIDGNPLNELMFKHELSLNRFSAQHIQNIETIGTPFNIKARKSNSENETSCIEIFISHCNKLNIIQENTFKDIDICYLDISNNQLSEIPENAAQWSNIFGVNLQGNPWDCQCKMQWILDTMLKNLYNNFPTLLHELRCETPSEYQGLRFIHWYNWGERAFCDSSAVSRKTGYYQLSPSIGNPSVDEAIDGFSLKNNTTVIVLILCIIVGIAVIIGLITYLARGRFRHNRNVMKQVNRRRQTPDDAKLKSNYEESGMF